MRQRIIVGYDGSSAAEAALEWAFEEAVVRQADVAAYTVVERSLRAAGGSVRPEPDEQAVRQAAGERRVDVHTLHGHPATELIEAARDADLLVVGASGHSALPGLLLGSVSRSCLHLSRRPVVVVRARPADQPDTGRVVVGVDMSRDSREALRVGAEEARLRGAELVAVHAVHWDNIGAELITPSEEQLVEWGDKLLADEIATAGVAATPLVVPGHPLWVLTEESEHADLLVLGSRGHSPLVGAFLGSVSDYCARHANCPVMIVRNGPGEAAAEPPAGEHP